MIDYPPQWHDGTIQARIRESANYTCEICGLCFDPVTNKALDGQPLSGHVHHLDHYPPNCADDNLIFLCQNCHIRLHGQGWKPGDEMPVSWGNEPPPWLLRRGLPYKPNPVVTSLQESAKYATRREDRARFLIGLIESQGWISGMLDPLAEMRGILKAVLAEYESLLAERIRAQQAPVLRQAEAWAGENGLVTYAEALKLSGLTRIEFDAAIQQGLVAPQPCPFAGDFIPAYFDPDAVQLDVAGRGKLTASMTLTREQAAEYLGVPVAVFERRRREAGIRHLPGRGERCYRKVDVDKLRK